MNWFNNALPFAKHSPSQGVVTTGEFSRHAEQAKYRVRQNHVSGAKIPFFGRTLPHYHPYLQVFWMHSNNFLRVEGLFVNFWKVGGLSCNFRNICGQNGILEIFGSKCNFGKNVRSKISKQKALKHSIRENYYWWC